MDSRPADDILAGTGDKLVKFRGLEGAKLRKLSFVQPWLRGDGILVQPYICTYAYFLFSGW